jgi:hypothetical protein
VVRPQIIAPVPATPRLSMSRPTASSGFIAQSWSASPPTPSGASGRGFAARMYPSSDMLMS